MSTYRYEEQGQTYRAGKTLRSWRPQFQIILSWIEEGSKVLDVGCGDGALGEFLQRDKNCEVFGIDLDSAGVAEARRRGVKARVVDANDGLPFKSKSFDVAIMCGLLEFLRKPDFVVAETLRVSERAIFSISNFGFWLYRLEHLFGKFPSFALYGHAWWETDQIKFFSLADFLALPSLQNATVKKLSSIDWKNKEKSQLAKLNPNLFGRNCIIEIEKP